MVYEILCNEREDLGLRFSGAKETGGSDFRIEETLMVGVFNAYC